MPPKKAAKKPAEKASPLNADKFNDLMRHFKPNNNIEIQPETWILPNRVKFNDWIKQTFDYSKKPQKGQLFPSQRFVKDFLQYESPYRGLLLLHSLGLGKSMASIVAAENLIHKMDVVILLPASLKPNYIDEIKKAGNTFFTRQQNWAFVKLEKIQDIIEDVCKQIFLDKKFITSRKGVWMPLKLGDPNYDQLSESDKLQINEQIDAMIESKYTFINYNASNIGKAYIQGFEEELKTKGVNYFDNKVIIIDEVHNYISRSLKPATLGQRLFKLMHKAKNAKFILLSGTPIINYPYEVSFLVNLLRGPQYTYELSFASGKFDPTKVSKVLDENKYVDNYEADIMKRKVNVQLVPDNFVFADKENFAVVRDDTRTSADSVIKALSKDLSCSVKGPFVNTILPITKEEFNKHFIDFDTETVKNPRMFSRHIVGCVSYFGTYFGDVYPDKKEPELIKLDMSDHQFDVYKKSREVEREKEQRAKKFAKKKKGGDNDLFSSQGQVYRAYSRANCNFVFPEGIERPYPGKMSLLYKEEIDVEEEDEVLDEDEKFDNQEVLTYKEQIKKVLDKLDDNADKFLNIKELSKYSPKYAALLPKLNECPGKALVYSQFRTVEGLGVLSKALNANGWAEFKVKKNDQKQWELNIKPEDMDKPKYFQYKGNAEETKFLMKVFNNNLEDVPENMKSKLSKDNLRGDIIKLIMITQSGAEGISLKHVRQVHVMEPYWNEIRIDQVIGRAVRANSHVDLPKSERNVSIYRYLVKMTSNQIKSVKTIENIDRKMTTDEYIHDVAQRKAKIINQIQTLVKNSSVDCQVHEEYHKGAVTCLSFPPSKSANDLGYHLDLEKEELDYVYKQKIVKKKETVSESKGLRRCKINGVYYAFDQNKKFLYDLEAYKNKRLVVVGEIVVNRNGNYRIIQK